MSAAGTKRKRSESIGGPGLLDEINRLRREGSPGLPKFIIPQMWQALRQLPSSLLQIGRHNVASASAQEAPDVLSQPSQSSSVSSGSLPVSQPSAPPSGLPVSVPPSHASSEPCSGACNGDLPASQPSAPSCAAPAPVGAGTPSQAKRSTGRRLSGPRIFNRPSLSTFTIRELKTHARELGVDVSACTEKGELVALLRAATSRRPSSAAPPAAAPGPSASARSAAAPSATSRRSSRHRRSSASKGGRRSKLRRLSITAAALSEEERSSLQLAEVRRIIAAASDLEVLNLPGASVRRMSRDERGRVVLRRFRALSRLVHPDKCPQEHCAEATAAFQRLEVARQQIAAKAPDAGISPSARRAAAAAAAAVAVRCRRWGLI